MVFRIKAVKKLFSPIVSLLNAQLVILRKSVERHKSYMSLSKTTEIKFLAIFKMSSTLLLLSCCLHNWDAFHLAPSGGCLVSNERSFTGETTF